MNGLFSRLAFTGFGPLAFSPLAAPALTVVNARRPARLRDKVRTGGPRRPGVYGMVDAAGELIYVGKAKCLRSRLLSYFRPNSRDPKAGRTLEHTLTIVWEPAPSEFAALLRELELIRRWQPRCNVHGQPRRYRRTYLCVGRPPAPYVFLAARPPATAKFAFGPVPGGETARTAARSFLRLSPGCPKSTWTTATATATMRARSRVLSDLARTAANVPELDGRISGTPVARIRRVAFTGPGARRKR